MLTRWCRNAINGSLGISRTARNPSRRLTSDFCVLSSIYASSVTNDTTDRVTYTLLFLLCPSGRQDDLHNYYNSVRLIDPVPHLLYARSRSRFDSRSVGQSLSTTDLIHTWREVALALPIIQ